MRDFSRPRTFILSAERSELSIQENLNRTNALRDILMSLGIPFNQGRGKYQGTSEACFIVPGAIHQPWIAKLAQLCSQESYLAIAENDRAAYLVFSDGYHKHIGRFVGHGTSEPSGDYTVVGGYYYYKVEPRDGVDLPEGF